ncbi:hypothetical protein [Planctomicrobium sp. SH664]|uniref:hypothetical protein n=1 Tax=Planctomicrobium sp. SH664 TaxID=3448125 RepID=UPI003F5BEE74
MSRRRRKTGAAITLFSFQDIIMSTSGIVIMIALLLSLELIQRRGAAADAVIPDSSSRLRQDIAQAQQEIAAIEERLKASDELVRGASGFSRVELQSQVQNRKDENAALKQQLDAAHSELRRWAQAEPELARLRQEFIEVEQSLQQARSEGAAVQRELDEVIQNDRPVFSMPRGSRQAGWLVDISETRIQVAPLERAAVPLVFERKGKFLLGQEGADEQFLQWAGREAAGSYFFLMVRPQGLAHFRKIAKQFDQNQTGYGFDLLDSEQILLHPERGAVQ